MSVKSHIGLVLCFGQTQV